MGHREANLLRLRARERDDLGYLLCGEFRRRPTSSPVGENVAEERLQLIIRRVLRLGLEELRVVHEPALAPPTGSLWIDAHPPGLRRAGLPGRGPQHEGDPLSEPLRERPGPREPIQDQPLTHGKLDTGCVARHPIVLILAIDPVKQSQLQPGRTRA